MAVERRPKLSPEQARSFGTYSVANALAVAMAFPCGCEAYQDTYTFGRWLAQGYAVRKGEHGTHISVKHAVERKDKDTGEIEFGERWGTAVVFCRHQVEVRTAPAAVAAILGGVMA